MTENRSDDSFDLYDLRVEVVAPPDAKIQCSAKLGDSFELRGEMLLAMNRPREAHDAFARSLALQPNRLLSVQGLAAAARAMTTTGHSGE